MFFPALFLPSSFRPGRLTVLPIASTSKGARTVVAVVLAVLVLAVLVPSRVSRQVSGNRHQHSGGGSTPTRVINSTPNTPHKVCARTLRMESFGKYLAGCIVCMFTRKRREWKQELKPRGVTKHCVVCDHYWCCRWSFRREENRRECGSGTGAPSVHIAVV